MRRTLALGSLVCLVPCAPAGAWDLFGHHVVGAIAWHHLDAETRRAATELLLEAPPDADLASLYPPSHRPREERAEELFLKAGGWADLVRDELWPERKERYDHPTWHFVNRFWRPTPEGPERLEAMGTLGELVVRLEEARAEVADRSRPDSERAIALAWLLHLTGDVHQPLHSSGRVTRRDPEGDRGGNDFELMDPEAKNLHYYWDSIFERARPERAHEGYFQWVERVARELEGSYSEVGLRRELEESSPEDWSRDAAEIAMRSAYPEGLARGGIPSLAYQETVFVLAGRQAVLAGLRMARLVEAALSSPKTRKSEP